MTEKSDEMTAEQKAAAEKAEAEKAAEQEAAAKTEAAGKPAHEKAEAKKKPAAPAEKAAEKKPAAKKKRDVKVLRVAGPERGRRRAGHAFGKGEVELRVEDLTKDQVAAIQSDPLLVSTIETRSEEVEAEDA